ncbi:MULTISPECIES: metallophosphoesterase family protein [unclassified Roseovarius]|uniref:metallophosphoesterase family protein n=1 Tax=unclassified Roseovarius TaxID=2614913 RepID=UPI00273D1117|nr:metallophosphoesterase family protein [Roseovarius sp. MMSF_3350]
MTKPLCVIPDIHGYRAEMDRVLSLVARHEGPDARIVFLGDYTDRGPDSRGVIQTLIDGIAAGRDWTALRGNHDQMFLNALEGTMEPERFQWWMQGNLGGRETLASYGIKSPAYEGDWREQVPGVHRQFLSTLPYTHETDQLFLCHAGISPGTPLERQVPEDLLWIRDAFLYDTRDHGKLVVHGHTPVDAPEHHGNRVALDVGAGWGRPLRAAVFEGRRCWVLTEAGRKPLEP